MARTGPPLVLAIVVPVAASDPAPRSTVPSGTWIVAETVYLPAARATTWFLPLHPSRAVWMADVASPPCAGTEAQIVERTGRPSGPRGLPVAVSIRIPGFHVVVRSGSSRPAGGTLQGPPSQVDPPPPPEL